jgi:proteasome lid subunit RPN8/RPN11
MSVSSFVFIPADVADTIAAWSEKAYPNEGCGLLVGRFEKGGKTVIRLASVSNDLLQAGDIKAPTLPAERQGIGKGRTEFVMNPSDFNREALAAEKEGLDIVGVIHTHPDHPARPSQIDASQPFLAQWSNIIVTVEKGRFKEMKSWFRETDAEPFAEEPIRLAAPI